MKNYKFNRQGCKGHANDVRSAVSQECNSTAELTFNFFARQCMCHKQSQEKQVSGNTMDLLTISRGSDMRTR